MLRSVLGVVFRGTSVFISVHEKKMRFVRAVENGGEPPYNKKKVTVSVGASTRLIIVTAYLPCGRVTLIPKEGGDANDPQAWPSDVTKC